MSEPTLISPMLDGFLMGTPISDHNGALCCPAMKENSDHKYIVKMINVPASQKQLDALLLAGAYKNPADAIDYFKSQADDIVAEARILQSLSSLEGFLSYEECQVVPMERSEIGYQVYLLGSYRRTLEKYMRTTMLTHLEAINLGLDLCSALATARRAGYVYVDLKPSNIFLMEDKSYRIGDLGFVALQDFSFASLPGKYESPYVPPELRDPMVLMNATADTYSLGMVLYQVYNDGQLPKQPEQAEAPFETPCNADYELAEIILKALSPKVGDRYQDPQEMGQALAAYMQKNEVNATPVTPASTVISDPQDIVEPEEPVLTPEEASLSQPTLEEIEKEQQEIPEDETLPTAEDAPQPTEPVELSEEVTKIIQQADELIVHETPGGVDMPKACKDPFENFDPQAQVDWTQVDDYIPDPLHEEMLEQQRLQKKAAEEEEKENPHIKINWVVFSIVTVIAVILLSVTGFFYYRFIYCKAVDSLTIEGTINSLTVSASTKADEKHITVVCTDAYGNKIRQPLLDGKSEFQNLQADAKYTVHLEISGFHKLTGKTQETYTTEARTSITSFNAVVGAENGSVELNFTTEGQEPSEWIMIYGTETEETKKQVFYGHSCTIKNLTVDKTYHFELRAGGDTTLVGGGNTLDFLAVNILLAQNVRITSDSPDVLSVHWDAPEGVDVPSWNVRCYDGEGYDENVDVVMREAHFTNINSNQSYIIEVLAEGMTQTVRATITDNPITVKDFQVHDEDPNKLTFTWDFIGTPPRDGWLVTYRMDDGPRQVVVPCEEPSLSLVTVVPDTTYHLDIRSATGVSTFEGVYSHKTAKPDFFNLYGFDGSSVEAKVIKAIGNKDHYKPEEKQSSFRINTRLSLFMHTNKNFQIPDEEVTLQYVLRDEYGNVQTRSVVKETVSWKSIWEGSNYHDGLLTLPITPNKGGKYSITIYADGMTLASANFVMSNR